MKTSELIGPALDWAVAKCEGRTDAYWMNDSVWGSYSPHTNWALAGPIIEREGIAVRRHGSGTWYAMLSTHLGDSEGARWVKASYVRVPFSATGPTNPPIQERFDGPTALIAAMRCYVASKLGDEIEIPEELR